jgi:uncharacterized protein (TIGR02265 family)
MAKAPPPKSTQDGLPFVEPPWNAELDVDALIASIPRNATMAGMFFMAVMDGARRRGIKLTSLQSRRYVQFSFYPLADFARLLVEAGQRFHPDRSLRQALRTIGTVAPKALIASTLGKVTLGSAEGVHAAVGAMAATYGINVRPSSCTVLDSGPEWLVLSLDEIQYFLDTHHVGVFEGTMRHAGVDGRVHIASRSRTSAELVLDWSR